ARREKATQAQVFRAVTGFLRALARVRPLALFLDDLQWADDISLALLLYVARELQDILILGTYRDVEIGRKHPLERILRELTHDRWVKKYTSDVCRRPVPRNSSGHAPSRILRRSNWSCSYTNVR